LQNPRRVLEELLTNQTANNKKQAKFNSIKKLAKKSEAKVKIKSNCSTMGKRRVSLRKKKKKRKRKRRSSLNRNLKTVLMALGMSQKSSCLLKKFFSKRVKQQRVNKPLRMLRE
jgi:hypothetical protein